MTSVRNTEAKPSDANTTSAESGDMFAPYYRFSTIVEKLVPQAVSEYWRGLVNYLFAHQVKKVFSNPSEMLSDYSKPIANQNFLVIRYGRLTI